MADNAALGGDVAESNAPVAPEMWESRPAVTAPNHDAPGIVLMTKGMYLSLVTAAFLGGLLLSWMIWGAP